MLSEKRVASNSHVSALLKYQASFIDSDAIEIKSVGGRMLGQPHKIYTMKGLSHPARICKADIIESPLANSVRHDAAYLPR